jgi:hypothetical protein
VPVAAHDLPKPGDPRGYGSDAFDQRDAHATDPGTRRAVPGGGRRGPMWWRGVIENGLRLGGGSPVCDWLGHGASSFAGLRMSSWTTRY